MRNYCDKFNLKLVRENLEIAEINKFDICVSVHWRKKLVLRYIIIVKKAGSIYTLFLPKYAGCSS